MECIICHKNTDSLKEGTVCKECRRGFESMSDGYLYVYCTTCDKHGFPCTGCAEKYFDCLLGPGNSENYKYNKEENKTICYIFDMLQNYSIEDNICQMCGFTDNEGRICRCCRQDFLEMVDVRLENYDQFITCVNCDTHGFPCYNCAKYVFKGSLGLGDDIVDTKELLTILYTYDNSWNETGSSTSSSQEYYDIDEDDSISVEDIKVSSSYCSIQ